MYRIFSVEEFFLIRVGVEWYHDFPSRIFCPTVLKTSWETLQCFRRLQVSEKFMFKKRISRFSIQFFLSHSAERIRRELFFLSEKIGNRKLLCIVEWRSSPFCRKSFVPQCRRTSFGNPSVFQKVFGRKKFWDRGGCVSRFFVKNLLSNSVEKLRRGILLCFRKLLVSKNVHAWEGRPSRFLSKSFCLTRLKG